MLFYIGTVGGKLNLTADTEYNLDVIGFSIKEASIYPDTRTGTATKDVPIWSVDSSNIDENKYTYVRTDGVWIIDSCTISVTGESALKYTHDDTKYSFIVGAGDYKFTNGVDLGTDYKQPIIIKLSEVK